MAAAVTARVVCSHFRPPHRFTAEEEKIIKAAVHEEQEWSRMYDEYCEQLNAAVGAADDNIEYLAIRERLEPLKAKVDEQYKQYLKAWNQAAEIGQHHTH